LICGRKIETLIEHSTDWLNHLQFSPADPTLLLYCHEGAWQMVDRIWTIRTDGTQNQLIHQRTMEMEIAGHEWWGADGKRFFTSSIFRAAAASRSSPATTSRPRSASGCNTVPDAIFHPRQLLARRQTFLRRWRQQLPWIFLFRPVFDPRPAHPWRKFDQGRLLGIGETGQHVQAQLSPRTEPQLYARPEIHRFSLEHVWAGLRLCGRSCEGQIHHRKSSTEWCNDE
jgi:hypothetical protein